jgi:hypothetical protein
MTFNNPKKANPITIAEKIVDIFEDLKIIGLRNHSIYTTENKIIFSFKGGVNAKINGKFIFVNQIVRLEYNVIPKGRYSSNLFKEFVSSVGEFF